MYSDCCYGLPVWRILVVEKCLASLLVLNKYQLSSPCWGTPAVLRRVEFGAHLLCEGSTLKYFRTIINLRADALNVLINDQIKQLDDAARVFKQLFLKCNSFILLFFRNL